MNKEEIINYLIDFQNVKYDGNAEHGDEDEAFEILNESADYYEEIERHTHRWWDEVIYVGKFGDKYFKFPMAHANRDESVFDLGWNFYWDDVKEVEAYTETITVTKYKEKE
ncbi:MAG: hypothetical protein ACOC1O_00610 [bacterium]